MSSELTKQEAQAQQVQHQSASQGARDVETQEHHAKASASGGLNLNLFGALSGALSSKSKKTTHTNADGSSTSVEDRHDKGESSAPRSSVAQPIPIIRTLGEACWRKCPRPSCREACQAIKQASIHRIMQQILLLSPSVPPSAKTPPHMNLH